MQFSVTARENNKSLEIYFPELARSPGRQQILIVSVSGALENAFHRPLFVSVPSANPIQNVASINTKIDSA